ncbi:unnamed protein product [Agarophyton chilense]
MDANEDSEVQIPLYSKPEFPNPQVSSQQFFATFFILGLGVLLPWNAMISSLDYYATVHKDIPIAQYITNSYSAPLLVSGLLPLTGLAFQTTVSILVCFGWLAAITTILPCVAHSVAATSVVVVFMGLCGGLLQSLLFGAMNYFPGGVATTAFNAGCGAASAVIVTLRILTRLAMGGEDSAESMKTGVRLFFVVCTFLSIACLVVFHNLTKTREYEAVPKTSATQLTSAYDTLHDIAEPATCLFLCFFGTMMLFPGILTQVPAQLRNDNVGSWFPLIAVASLAFGDTAGRLLWSRELVLYYPQALTWMSCARLIVLPFHVLQWINGLPVTLMFAYGTVFFHGFLNGFIMNMAFVNAPSMTSDNRLDTVGKLMFAMLISGIFVGSFAGWALDWLLRSFKLL